MNTARELLEWDWLDTSTGRVLHHAEITDEQAAEMDDWAALHEPIRLSCGRTVKSVWIPGIFTRMGRQRCTRCCDALGYPHGKGSPKNDPACRPLAEARISEPAH